MQELKDPCRTFYNLQDRSKRCWLGVSNNFDSNGWNELLLHPY